MSLKQCGMMVDMTNAEEQLAEFAATAEVHAAEVHGIEIGRDALDSVDQLLDRYRAEGVSDDRDSLALCYGCWLARYVIDRYSAYWVGLGEPVAPRICMSGIVCSPIDAVRRRLTTARARSLRQLDEDLQRWLQLLVLPRDVQTKNRAAWDQLAGDPHFAGTIELPPDRDAARDALDPWLAPEVTERTRVLCLGAGGGTHGPLFAIAGAQVTVVDFSAAQLRLDEQVARSRQLDLTTVLTSMDDLSTFAAETFDCVVQPVSGCYVRRLTRVYAEVARVLRPGGLYVVQHKQPASLQAGSLVESSGYRIDHPAVEGWPLAPTADQSLMHRERETYEFLHTLDSLLGGLCRSGFVIEDIYEPPRGDAWAPIGSLEHRAAFLPPYIKIKARRIALPSG